MENNYSVYQHVTPDGMHYYGATNNIKRRWEGNGRLYKTTALQPYIEKYGWNNIQHIILFENQSKEDALKIEDSLIISGWEKGNCINQQRSGNISKEEGYYREYRREYREENREKYNEYQREYQREYHREYHREYREQNKDEFRKYQREYRRKNKDKINEYYRQRYQENLSKNREKNRIKQQKYYQRKKEEKQFRELGYVPLF